MQEHTEIREISWTGERYVPAKKGNLQLAHLHRYALSCEFVRNKAVLDIACGEGYGSAMLAQLAKKVYGVDISKEIIEHAQAKYKKDNLQFKVGSCEEIPLKDSSVDIVVSFETIEHHNQHKAMIQEIKRVLKPDGILIISSPDKHEYSDVPGGKNPYHVKELYYDEFRSLLETYFCNVNIYGQRVIFGSGIFPEKGQNRMVSYSLEKLERNDFKQTCSNGISKPLYLIAVASDSKISCSIGSLLEQPVVEGELFKQTVIEKDQVIAEKDQVIAEKDRVIVEKDRAITNWREELYSVYTSQSWRYTTPLRKIGTLIRRVLRLPHKPRIRAVIKRAYFMLPAFIRKSRLIENLKNRFKSKEVMM